MALLKIARMGHPVLWRTADPVGDAHDPALQRLIDDMIETMRDADGVGLAAPQVHESRRLIVVLPLAGREDDSRPEPLPILDPVLEPLGETVEEGLEGCLSIPDLRGIVPRWQRLRWRGRSREGRPIGGVAEGFFARVLQHEVDHLDGILYPMRMTDLSLLAFVEHQRHLIERAAEDDHADVA